MPNFGFDSSAHNLRICIYFDEILHFLYRTYDITPLHSLLEDSSSPVRISFSAAGDDDEVTPLLSVPSMTAGSGDVTPVRITPLASQTATPHNTPLSK